MGFSVDPRRNSKVFALIPSPAEAAFAVQEGRFERIAVWKKTESIVGCFFFIYLIFDSTRTVWLSLSISIINRTVKGFFSRS